MTPKAPVLDLFVGRDRKAWRLYVAPRSWMPMVLSARADEHREVFPVRTPNVAELDAFMFEADAPYTRHLTLDGGIEIRAEGRSAIVLHSWLEELVG